MLQDPTLNFRIPKAKGNLNSHNLKKKKKKKKTSTTKALNPRVTKGILQIWEPRLLFRDHLKDEDKYSIANWQLKGPGLLLKIPFIQGRKVPLNKK